MQLATDKSQNEEELKSTGGAMHAILRQHMPEVDVLRGVAIIAVIVFHGTKYSAPNLVFHSTLLNFVYNATDAGWAGVNLFFVLSGFLITGILSDTVDHANYYPRFYIRRSLRILPAYLLILFLLAVTKMVTMPYLVVCLLFLTNMPGLLKGALAADKTRLFVGYPVLWSLAVEEQFYLIWPFLYRKLRPKAMMILVLAIIVICPILRTLSIAGVLHTGETYSKTWMIADNLAIGAFIALLLRSQTASLLKLQWLTVLQLLSGSLVLAYLWKTGQLNKQNELFAGLGFSSIEQLCSGILILMLLFYSRHKIPRSFKFFVFFGDISYGLYLYHYFIFELYDKISKNELYQHNFSALLIRFAVCNGSAIAFAYASRRYVEDPILGLKKRFALAR